MTWLLDLDGVVWRGDEPILGSATAIGQLRANGVRVAFVTNNSSKTPIEQAEKLTAMGIRATAGDIVSAIDVLADMLGPEPQRVMCATGPSIPRVLAERGHAVWSVADFVGAPGDMNAIRTPPDVDIVIAGQRFDIDYGQMSVAARAILQCGRFLVPNTDPLYPHSSGMLLGSGAIAAALATASGVTPQAAGKPYPPMTRAVRKRFPDTQMVVGDQIDMDGELARQLGVSFALVESGVQSVRPGTPSSTPVKHVAPTLAHLVNSLFS